MPKKKIEMRTEWGADRQEKVCKKDVLHATAWTTRRRLYVKLKNCVRT